MSLSNVRNITKPADDDYSRLNSECDDVISVITKVSAGDDLSVIQTMRFPNEILISDEDCLAVYGPEKIKILFSWSNNIK